MRLNVMLLDGGVDIADVQQEYNSYRTGERDTTPTPAPTPKKDSQKTDLTATEKATYTVDEQTKIAQQRADAAYRAGERATNTGMPTVDAAVDAAKAKSAAAKEKIEAAKAKSAAAKEKIAAAKTKIASAQGKIDTAKAAQSAAAESDNTALTDLINSLSSRIETLTGQVIEAQNRPTAVGQITRRQKGGTVQVVSLFSDGTEKVIDEYKDFSARDSVMAMFENTGLGKAFLDSLMGTIDQVYTDNIAPTDAQILNSIYNSDAYKTRFAANETIRKRMAEGKGRPGDRLLNPAEYVKTEEAYREIMSEAGLPAGFYDQQEDFTAFIAELGTSVAEITERVNIAKQALQNADSQIKQSLKSYYGLTENDMVAYLLDPQKAFDVLNSRFRYTSAEAKQMYTSAEVGGAALRAGMGAGITKAFAEEITKAGKEGEAERAFQGAARDQEDYQRLTSLYGETSTQEDLAREALGLAGGAEVAIKARKLASKERAKFATRGAIDRTSLGSRNKTPDV
jgi:predicted  nucleic acid-binding Zn-ribbon protein